MRLPTLLPVLALGLISGCGGGGSSGSGATGPTAQEKEMALSFTSSLVMEVSAYYSPDAWTPPPLAGEGSASLAGIAANAFTCRGASAPLLPARAFPLTPCVGATVTSGPDLNGYFTATTDYGSCTDGTSGQILTRWKQTSSFFDLTVAFNAFTVSVVSGGTVITERLNGSLTVIANHSGNTWTAHYSMPSLVVDASGGGTTLHVIHTADFNETFLQTSAAGQPVSGDFSIYGTSTWNTGLATYSASVAQATPLRWEGLGLLGACPYPISGHIAHAINGRGLGVTFTSTCGIVRLDDGSSADLRNY